MEAGRVSTGVDTPAQGSRGLNRGNVGGVWGTGRASRCGVALAAVLGLSLAGWAREGAAHETTEQVAAARGASDPHMGGVARAELDPAWSWAGSTPIEWAAAVGNGEWAGILVAASDGALHLVDARCGTARWRAPVRAAPGVRPAGPLRGDPTRSAEVGAASGDVFVFDRHAVYALALRGDEGLRWCMGRPPAPGESYPDDPEHLGGWLGAHGTADGVLAIRRVEAGTEMLLLAAEDGRPVWKVPTPSVTEPRIHVADGPAAYAAVLWPQGRDSWLLVTTLGRDRPRPHLRRVPRWPAWSAATQDGIVTVFEAEATFWPWAAAPRAVRLEGAALAGRVALWKGALGPQERAPPGRRDSESQPKASEIEWLVVGHDGTVSAYDLTGGGAVWRQAWGAEVGALRRIDVVGAHVIVDRTDVVVACCAQSGRVVGRASAEGAVAVGATVCDGELRVLWVRKECVSLALTPLGHCAEPEATGTPRGTHASREWVLRGAGEPRDVLWSRDALVLVARDSLRAYVMSARSAGSPSE